MAMAILVRRSRVANPLTKLMMGPLRAPKTLQNLDPNPTTEASDGHKGQNPFGSARNQMTLFAAKRFMSIGSGESVSHQYDESTNNQILDFPGGKVKFTSEMRFLSESSGERINCYRVLDEDGEAISGSYFQEVGKEIATKMYCDMVTLQTMDTIFYEAQRQGRISFYVTSIGEEAINIASAAALTNDDVVFPQYREPGVLLWRGFTLQEFANQCFGNISDYGKGRQMPVHYGSNRLNYFTVASTIASQLPVAVGAAYSLKMDRKNACSITYFGDGGTSEGDFHAAMNFAAVTEAPVIFFCRNNGWAISTPTTEQFRSDGVVIKGQAYGIRCIRVDGNDALAVYSAVHAAREMAISKSRPILVEALTYRAGHHSTSDDSTKYRPVDEIEHWRRAEFSISVEPDEESILNKLPIINKCFSTDSVEEIIKSFEIESSTEGNEWIGPVLKGLRRSSPTGLKITFRSIRGGRKQTLPECLKKEFRLTMNLLRSTISGDIYEGIRALSIDKDNAPKWEPSKLAEVRDEKIDQVFEPFSAELELQIPAEGEAFRWDGKYEHSVYPSLKRKH